jgi:hypothetical protein
MEIIDKTNGSGNKPVDWGRHIYLGIALIVVGAVWMLYNFDLVDYRFFDVFFSWEMLVIVIGGYLLSLRRWVWGGVVTAVGVFFLLTNLLDIHIPFDKVVWPSIFILAGIGVLLTRAYKR